MTTNEFSPEFNSPFMTTRGKVDLRVDGLWAPEVYHDDQSDIEILSDEWQALTGYTGQYGYDGAVMHPSEQFSGGLAQYTLDNDGIYVIVEVMDYDDQDALVGWAVLEYTGPAGPCCPVHSTYESNCDFPGYAVDH